MMKQKTPQLTSPNGSLSDDKPPHSHAKINHEHLKTLLREAINANNTSIINLVKYSAHDKGLIENYGCHVSDQILHEHCNTIVDTAIEYSGQSSTQSNDARATYYYARLLTTLAGEIIASDDPMFAISLVKYSILLFEIIDIRTDDALSNYQLAKIFNSGYHTSYWDDQAMSLMGTPEPELAHSHYLKANKAIDKSHPEFKNFNYDFTKFFYTMATDFHSDLSQHIMSDTLHTFDETNFARIFELLDLVIAHGHDQSQSLKNKLQILQRTHFQKHERPALSEYGNAEQYHHDRQQKKLKPTVTTETLKENIDPQNISAPSIHL